MIITRYTLKGPKLKAAVVADLHSKPTKELIDAIISLNVDAILIPGDLCTIKENRKSEIDIAIDFLKKSVEIAPTFYSLGNHESYIDSMYRQKVKDAGAILLENKWIKFKDINIGGLSNQKHSKQIPDLDWLKNSPKGFKILLNHRPEYYDYISEYADLVISGHTHGAQIRLFNKGIFAPGQGFFPKYSKGQYGNMIVSAGLTNTARFIPRINNPCELVIIDIN